MVWFMRKSMKNLSGILLLLLISGIVAKAQEFNPKAEIIKSSEKIVKGAPFSAEAISESIQFMFDGNKITRSSESRIYRDGEGRFRRDEMSKPVGIGSFVEISQSIYIFDPVAGLRFYLDANSKTVRRFDTKKDFRLKSNKEFEIKDKKREIRIETRVEIKRDRRDDKRTDRDEKPAQKPNSPTEPNKKIKPPDQPKTPVEPKKSVFPSMAVPAGEVKNEALGRRNIEGVEAEGTRQTNTIAAGAIGNERAFEIVYERWYSKELQLIVLSKYSDPRFGEQTYQLTNIKRAEPDGELFKVPSDYKPVEDKKPPTIEKKKPS
jgi:hypothetical protein